jgi:hypothetical protein
MKRRLRRGSFWSLISKVDDDRSMPTECLPGSISAPRGLRDSLAAMRGMDLVR